MKKIKFHKKRNKKEKLVQNPKIFLIAIGLLLNKIFILIIIIFFIFKFKKNKIKQPETISPNEIMYKGSIILKTKLISDYFSRISIEEQKEEHEKQNLNKLLNLSEYSDDINEKNNYKNQFLKFFSKIKKKQMNQIDTLFISQNCNFGNCIITINNIIFYCEIVGCHYIIFKDHHSLIRNPIYIKKLNITIIPGSKANCKDEYTLCPTLNNWDPFHPIIIKSQIRTQYLKEEILKIYLKLILILMLYI